MDVAKLKYVLNATLSIRIPEDLLEKARAKSDDTGISLSHVVRTGLDIWVRSAQWPAIFGLELEPEEETALEEKTPNAISHS